MSLHLLETDESNKRKAYEVVSSSSSSSDRSGVLSADGCWYLLLSYQMSVTDFDRKYIMKRWLKELDFESSYLDIFQKKLDELKFKVTSEERSRLFFWLFSDKGEAYDYVKNDKKPLGWNDIFEIIPLIKLTMTQEEAEDLLDNEPSYTFLIRLSNTYARCFVLSFARGEVVLHRRFAIKKYYLLFWALLSNKNVKGRAFPRNGETAKDIVMEVCRYAAAEYDEDDMKKTRFLNGKTKESKIEYSEF